MSWYEAGIKDLIGDLIGGEPLYDGDVIVCPEPAGFSRLYGIGISTSTQ